MPAGMSAKTSAAATFPFRTRSCCSFARKAARNSGFWLSDSLGIGGFPNLKENVYPGKVGAHENRIIQGLARLQPGHVRRVAINEVPIEQVLHAFTHRIARIYVRRNQQSTGGEPIMHDAQKPMANRIGEVIK